MGKYVIDETTLVDIGNAIRGKTGKTDLILPKDMPTEIAGIEGGSGGIPVGIITRELTECSNSDAEKIGAFVFSNFNGLVSVDFPNVKVIGNYAFEKCYSLTEANFPAATSIGEYAFYYCSSLTEVNFPVATSIGYSAFEGCSSLTEANFPVATSTGDYTFCYCSSLTEANFPVATSIGDSSFKGCPSLTEANFPVATSIGYSAFMSCMALETVDLPVANSIDSYAFRYDQELKSLILRNPDNVCTLLNKNAFNGSSILNETGYIYVPSALIEQYKVATNWSTYATQFRALESYTVDGTITGELDETKI